MSDRQTDRKLPREGHFVLLTGATGYVGGRLLRRLEERGVRVRCLVRRPEHLRERVGGSTEVVGGDVLDAASLVSALEGIDTAYYLIHSMGSTGSFEEKDRRAAENFAGAARAAGVKRIIYLGGLGEEREALSAHLESRHEVGEVLRSTGVQVIEFRASIVLGSGSLSFELIRSLVERLPIMVTPRWVSVPAQPIAIEDVLEYLVAGLDHEVDGSRIYEIGGTEQVSYGDLMREYARQRGLRRVMIRVPVLTPWLSSLWLGLVTPLYARVGRKLIESIRHPTVVRDDTARREFAIKPKGYREAIAAALRNEDRAMVETRWCDAVSAGGSVKQADGVQTGTRYLDGRTAEVGVPPDAAFAPIRRIGGNTGWYFGNWLWRLRGWIDLAFGGVGMRRGRRDPESLRPGDVLDFWRVDAYQPDRRLLLHAEMKLPGRAWLEFAVEPTARGSTIHQTAIYEPLGVWGRAYWYLVYPLHQLVFARMLRGIVAAARRASPPRGGEAAPGWGTQFLALLGFVALCLGVAAGGAALTSVSVNDWYPALAKPDWTPPDAVFGPVWTILYIAMGTAAWLVWRRDDPARNGALALFAIQLVLNVAWSALFFSWQSPGLAFFDIVLLWAAIAATLTAFWRVSVLAGALFVPYLVWVTYAAALNYAIWNMNT